MRSGRDSAESRKMAEKGYTSNSRKGKANTSEMVHGCTNNGMRNHRTECTRRIACENCGYSNHSTYDCKRESLWNFGPELCAAQVDNQSFFYIDEIIDCKVHTEKSSTAISL